MLKTRYLLLFLAFLTLTGCASPDAYDSANPHLDFDANLPAVEPEYADFEYPRYFNFNGSLYALRGKTADLQTYVDFSLDDVLYATGIKQSDYLFAGSVQGLVWVVSEENPGEQSFEKAHDELELFYVFKSNSEAYCDWFFISPSMTYSNPTADTDTLILQYCKTNIGTDSNYPYISEKVTA